MWHLLTSPWWRRPVSMLLHLDGAHQQHPLANLQYKEEPSHPSSRQPAAFGWRGQSEPRGVNLCTGSVQTSQCDKSSCFSSVDDTWRADVGRGAGGQTQLPGASGTCRRFCSWGDGASVSCVFRLCSWHEVCSHCCVLYLVSVSYRQCNVWSG